MKKSYKESKITEYTDGSLVVFCCGLSTIKSTIPLKACTACPNHMKMEENKVICNFRDVRTSLRKIQHQFDLLLEDLERKQNGADSDITR